MTDEKYTFITDVAEKKRTARGAFNKRTHNGKGGKVRFPSDYLSNKERNEMNGKVREYRMNSPITYSEFKKYPDDLKKNYVKRLRDMFDVSDTDIAADGIQHSSHRNGGIRICRQQDMGNHGCGRCLSVGAGNGNGDLIICHKLSQKLRSGHEGNLPFQALSIFRIVRMDGSGIDYQLGSFFYIRSMLSDADPGTGSGKPVGERGCTAVRTGHGKAPV